MYTISNQERRDIIRLLQAFRETFPTERSLRKANMVRVAGLLIEQLNHKTEFSNDLIKKLKHGTRQEPTATDANSGDGADSV
jgi:hypothetical protein